MSLLHTLGVQNTQNKIYNNFRRTYLDKNDFKEGESFCRKCKGVGEINAVNPGEYIETCPQCIGRGIVDWITQAVERPPLMTDSSSSSSAVSLYHKGVKLLETHSDGIKMFTPKQVTNYKRRKIV